MKLTPFGVEVRKRRVERGETQSDVARALGVSVAYWSSIETGKKNISGDLLVVLGRHFALTVEEIKRFGTLVDMSREEVNINIQRLSDPSRELVVGFARKFEENGLSELQLAKLREILGLKES